jgi:hypothetical protein
VEQETKLKGGKTETGSKPKRKKNRGELDLTIQCSKYAVLK